MAKTRHLFTPDEVEFQQRETTREVYFDREDSDDRISLEELFEAELASEVAVLCPYCRAEVFPLDFINVLECSVCGYTGPEETFNSK